MDLLFQLVFNDVQSNWQLADQIQKDRTYEDNAFRLVPILHGPDWNIVMDDQSGPRFKPGGRLGGKWRDLEILVTPDGVQGFMDGERTGELPVKRPLLSMLIGSATEGLRLLGTPAPRLEGYLRDGLTEAQTKFPNDPFLAQVPTEFKPRGGFGLYVAQGSATFRDISIAPLKRSGNSLPVQED